MIATHDERLLPLADRVVELTPRPPSESRPPERVELAAGRGALPPGRPPGTWSTKWTSGRIDIVQELSDGGETRARRRRTRQLLRRAGPDVRAATLGDRARRADGPAVVTGYTLRDFRARRGELTPTAVLDHAADSEITS